VGLAAGAVVGSALAASSYGYGYGYPAYGYGYGTGYGYAPAYSYGTSYGYAPAYSYGTGYGYPAYGYGYGTGYGNSPAYSSGYGAGYGYAPNTYARPIALVMGPVTALRRTGVTDTPITPLSDAMSMLPFMACGVIRTEEPTRTSSLSMTTFARRDAEFDCSS
jgi:hypothetical protein